MDIVSRLKLFMDHVDISSSQFADICHIPRPSLSQLLNGRNKKISDEIITKIHTAFPELSVLWLMFGEGDMVLKSNIEISEPQNAAKSEIGNTQNNGLEFFTNPIDSNFNVMGFTPENLTSTQNTNNEGQNLAGLFKEEPSKSSNQDTTPGLKTQPYKRISNIVVFYDDNSFESFIPTK